MNSTRIWMKLMGFHNFYTGKYSNHSLIGKDNRERFADKRTHQHSTDIACQCYLYYLCLKNDIRVYSGKH